MPRCSHPRPEGLACLEVLPGKILWLSSLWEGGSGSARSLCPSAEYLKEQLDTYMSQFPKVKILHLQERHGLIRARLAGAEIAKGRTGALFSPGGPQRCWAPSPALYLSLSMHPGCPFAGSASPSSTPAPAGQCQHRNGHSCQAGKKCSCLGLGRSGEPRRAVAQSAAPRAHRVPRKPLSRC